MVSTEIPDRSREPIEGPQVPAHAPRGWSRQPLLFEKEFDLVKRLRRGDETAYEEVMREFGGQLLATAGRYLRSEEDAQDALQDAFICAFKAIANFKGESQLSTWLHRIVVNCALGRLRSKRHSLEVQQTPVDDRLPHFDPSGNWMEENIRTKPADAPLETYETRALVRRCIAKLPDVYKAVLMLRDIDQLDTAEVAALLGLTATNVKVRLHRARQTLKVLIERERGL